MEKLMDHNFPKSSETSCSDNTTFSLSEPVSSCQSPLSSESDNLYYSPAFTSSGDKGKNDEKKKIKKLERKSSSFAYRIREHVRLGQRFSEMVKGKLSVGAKIIRKGGRDNIFKDIFGVNSDDGEKLLKASQCYLSTTAGPVAGILFVSTHKIAFSSERPVALRRPSSPSITMTSPYKVMIPVKKIKGANESENVNNPAQKYIQIVTLDDYEFWFMGFVRYEKAWNNLQRAISRS